MADQFTLDEFRNSFEEVARPNRFKVIFTGGEMDEYRSALTQQNMVFWCTKIQTPKIDISGPVIKYMGRSAMLAGDVKEMTTSLTFINALGAQGQASGRNFFENWMTKIVNHNIFTEDQTVSKYLQGNNITIYKYGTQFANNEPVENASYFLYNVLPVSLSELDLDVGSSDTLEEYTVEFRYTSWDNASSTGDGDIFNY